MARAALHLLPPTSRAEARRQVRAVRNRRVTASARRKDHAANSPNAAKLAYMRGLRKMIGEIWDLLVRELGVRQDAAGDLRVKIIDIINRDAPGLIGDVGRKVSDHNAREMRRLVGIDPRVDPGTGPVIDAFRRDNVQLITNLSEEMYQRVEAILRDKLAGVVDDVSDELESGLGFSEARADLIARDQTLKLNGQLTQVRQQNAGIDEYIWTTSGDERVRESHAAKDGQRFRWDNPPADTGHPGQDYQCRCTPYPVIPELDGDSGDDN